MDVADADAIGVASAHAPSAASAAAAAAPGPGPPEALASPVATSARASTDSETGQATPRESRSGCEVHDSMVTVPLFSPTTGHNEPGPGVGAELEGESGGSVLGVGAPPTLSVPVPPSASVPEPAPAPVVDAAALRRGDDNGATRSESVSGSAAGPAAGLLVGSDEMGAAPPPGRISSDSELDWDELERTEEIESQAGEVTDQSTALLLARLDQENKALATNTKTTVIRNQSKRASVQQIRQLVDNPPNSPQQHCRLSQLPPPRMTELEFWAALVSDYSLTAQRLPTLTSNKIRGGVPPPLRGVVWPSIAGARDPELAAEFQKLAVEPSPYEAVIGKDIARSFPNVDMFKDPEGEGQFMLARVLKAFSLYDDKIGYCQGLGFVVGPLLMHMSDVEAFCILVRLMDHYDLRACFLPTLAGLHLRTYQFQSLMARHLPQLHAHLEALRIEPVYLSQWFLSFFGVTCPLPMLLRIYDVLLVEGACETLMRVALSLMQRNQHKLLALTEFEDVMQLLLSRGLWDPYNYNANDLVSDFVSLTALVTRESLDALEAQYSEIRRSPNPQMQTAASRFLGRIWAGSTATSPARWSFGSTTNAKSLSPNGTISPEHVVRRTPSKQSMASTLNSLESTSDVSTSLTELSDAKKRSKPTTPSKDRDFHSQIEDLLMALTDLQRAQADLARDLQQEREERDEDRQVARMMMAYMQERQTDDSADLLQRANARFYFNKRESIVQTKHQLRDDVSHWKGRHQIEAARCQDLSRQIDDHQAEAASLREQLREARTRVQETYHEKQRLERTTQELRRRRPEAPQPDGNKPSRLRELKLGRPNSVIGTPPSPTVNRRMSSLSWMLDTQQAAGSSPPRDDSSSSSGGSSVRSPVRLSNPIPLPISCSPTSPLPTTPDEPPAQRPPDELLQELVTAKTAEAMARQELEEVKGQLEAHRRLLNKNGLQRSANAPVAGSLLRVETSPVGTGSTGLAGGAGGRFFGSWGKKTAPPS